ncbi:DUF4062 domain-containing protein [Afipia birgiae]|jgi:hypothetical protein|uniref:DUF4062 domain-containing protein n=1 Tax=Afipia birgiae TaxID=151414 RepID=UPI0002EB91B0|nr:DUF4062 domain-containing protein [Afipia birgiae]
MTDTRKIIRVFLASPGDLQDERRTAKAVVEEFNKLWADAMGYHVELIGWEDTISQYGRPQGIINQDLERCELVIGMMWKRWGTPPGKTNTFTSGFEEEFETSIASRRTKGRPEMALFFKDIDKELLRDPGEELKKVVAFKERIIAEKEIFFEPFGGVGDFEGKIRSCITAYIQKLRAAETEKIASETQATPTEAKPAVEADSKSKKTTPLSPQGTAFLREFIISTEEDSSDAYGPVEVARFRLLASALSKQGNDDNTIGAHDANLLYGSRLSLDLGDSEKRSLLAAGISHYSSENIPLWFWYAAVEGFRRKLLGFYSVFGQPRRQAEALEAMRLTHESLPVSKDFERNVFLDDWFAEGADETLKVAALSYLADCGVIEDLPYLKKEFDLGNYQTRSASGNAIVRINLRQGKTQAIAALYDLQLDSIGDELVEELFSNADQLAESVLVGGLSHRSKSVRQTTLRLLKERGKIDPQQAEQLLGDSDADVRYEAISALTALGRVFTNEQVKSLLVRPTSASASLLGFSGINTGEAVWTKFRQATILEVGFGTGGLSCCRFNF